MSATAEIHTDRRYYYVSAIDGPKSWILAGPYDNHPAALAQVNAVRRRAEKGHPFSVFYAFGTCGSDEIIKTPLGPDWCDQ